MRARVDAEAAAVYAEVKPDTVDRWRRRGKIRLYPDGYDLDELDDWLRRRHPGKAVGAALASHARHQASHSARARSS